MWKFEASAGCSVLPTTLMQLDPAPRLQPLLPPPSPPPACLQMHFRVCALLPKLLDLDHVLSSFVTAPRTATPRTARQAIAAIIALKHTLGLLPEIAGALEGATNGLLVAVRENLRHPALGAVKQAIDGMVTEDASWCRGLAAAQRQEIYAVRPLVDGNLDAVRKVRQAGRGGWGER